MLTAVFYILVLLCITVEIQTLTDTERVIRASKTLKEKQAEGSLDTLVGFDKNYMITSSFYTVIALIGLFSSQWPVFLLMLAMGIIMSLTYKHSVIGRKIDSVISVSLLLFIIINKYHLHLDLVGFLKTLV
jgi:hypothetical protein